jgi:sedoheptulokinase
MKHCGIGKRAFLNISTSAQIGYVTPEVGLLQGDSSGVEYFPYFDSSYLAVGASLNGGNVLASFVHSLQNLLQTFGLTISKGTKLILWRICDVF